MRELVYYIAVSLDGFIAGPHGEFDAFPVEGDHMETLVREYPDTLPTDIAGLQGIDQSSGRFSTVVMGWNTYVIGPENGMPSPYRHLEQIVFSRRHHADEENLRTTAEDPVDVVSELRAREGGDIWLCGGADLATQLRGQIDRLVLKHNPVVLGGGIPLFHAGHYAPAEFDLVRSRDYASGVVISEYER